MPARHSTIPVLAAVWGALFSAAPMVALCAAPPGFPDSLFADVDNDLPAWRSLESHEETVEPRTDEPAIIQPVAMATSVALEPPPGDVAVAELAQPGDEALSGQQLDGILSKLAWFTGAVGLAAIVSLWLLRLWFQRRETRADDARSLALVDSIRIGPRCGLYLVQADRHRVLVGIDQGRAMSLLALPPIFSDSLEDADVESKEKPATAKSKPVDRIAPVAEAFSALSGRRLFPMGGCK